MVRRVAASHLLLVQVFFSLTPPIFPHMSHSHFRHVSPRSVFWPSALPMPTQAELSSCVSALALHLGGRLDALLGRRRPLGLASPQQCESLRNTLPQLELPPLPDPKGVDFRAPPLPRLLPRALQGDWHAFLGGEAASEWWASVGGEVPPEAFAPLEALEQGGEYVRERRVTEGGARRSAFLSAAAGGAVAAASIVCAIALRRLKGLKGRRVQLRHHATCHAPAPPPPPPPPPSRQPPLQRLPLHRLPMFALLTGLGKAEGVSSAANASASALDGRNPMPATNPQGFTNHLWSWRGQTIRYQSLGERSAPVSLIHVHGLFVNADHWRRNLPAMAEAGHHALAIDLLGSGYSSKPAPCGAAARRVDGERERQLEEVEAELSDASGRLKRVVLSADSQRHPLGSCYNFFTWAEQIVDFVQEVVRVPGGGQVAAEGGAAAGEAASESVGAATHKTFLVCNSIGAISCLQAAIDAPALFSGVLIINPNFRELHVAEQRAPMRPITATVQAMLRRWGQPLFDALAKPATVKRILTEPYHDSEQVTDELVEVCISHQPHLLPYVTPPFFPYIGISHCAFFVIRRMRSCCARCLARAQPRSSLTRSPTRRVRSPSSSSLTLGCVRPSGSVGVRRTLGRPRNACARSGDSQTSRGSCRSRASDTVRMMRRRRGSIRSYSSSSRVYLISKREIDANIIA